MSTSGLLSDIDQAAKLYQQLEAFRSANQNKKSPANPLDVKVGELFLIETSRGLEFIGAKTLKGRWESFKNRVRMFFGAANRFIVNLQKAELLIARVKKTIVEDPRPTGNIDSKVIQEAINAIGQTIIQLQSAGILSKKITVGDPAKKVSGSQDGTLGKNSTPLKIDKKPVSVQPEPPVSVHENNVAGQILSAPVQHPVPLTAAVSLNNPIERPADHPFAPEVISGAMDAGVSLSTDHQQFSIAKFVEERKSVITAAFGQTLFKTISELHDDNKILDHLQSGGKAVLEELGALAEKATLNWWNPFSTHIFKVAGSVDMAAYSVLKNDLSAMAQHISTSSDKLDAFLVRAVQARSLLEKYGQAVLLPRTSLARLIPGFSKYRVPPIDENIQKKAVFLLYMGTVPNELVKQGKLPRSELGLFADVNKPPDQLDEKTAEAYMEWVKGSACDKAWKTACQSLFDAIAWPQ